MTNSSRRRFLALSGLAVAGIAGCSSQGSTPSDDSSPTSTPGVREELAVQYRFEGDLTDETGEYDLSGSGVSYVDGPEGSQAASWGGYASTEFTAIEPDEPLTFCYWMRDDSTEAKWDDLIWKISGGTGDDVGSFCTSSGEPFLFTTGSNTADESQTSVVDGEWHHVAFVYQQDESRMQLFIDGSQEYDIAYDDTLRGMAGTTLKFGNIDANGPKQFDGGLDDFRIYRRALSESEIQQIAGV